MGIGDGQGAIGRARRLRIGVEPLESGGAHARVWAPEREKVELVTPSGDRYRLEREAGGYFAGSVPLGAGARYGFQLDAEPTLYPDPASRFQPEGPHGLSEIVDPSRFAWSDAGWRGRTLGEAVIYELHVGTFTPEGTWAAATERLEPLAELGVTVIETMPVAEFPGRFGWGYDGVDLYAPYHGYGAPDDLRRFVDRAHALGLAVVLDVVYNHLGPDGNYLPRFSRHYFTDRYRTEWGEPIDFDGEHSTPVREFFVENAGYWIDEYHFDGLRLDATQNIYDFDRSPGHEHVLAAIARRVRERAPGRVTLVIGENEPQETRLLRPPAPAREGRGGYGLDALWNDDFHHSAVVALTGRREAYYRDYRGTPQELVSAVERGFLYQGQHYAWQKQRRGTSTHALDMAALVTFLENHDQVANSIDGRRLHQTCSPARYRALLGLQLLGTGTPMIFQGAEFLSSAPFLYFADHHGELAEAVRRGRAEFLAQFPSIAGAARQRPLDAPGALCTFERCKLDPSEPGRLPNATHRALVKALLALRRSDPVIGGARRAHVAGAVLSDGAFVVRYFGVEAEDGDRLLVVNLGGLEPSRSYAEPLIAPPAGARWRELLVTEDPRWGGRGYVPFEQDDGVVLSPECTMVFASEREEHAVRGAESREEEP